MSQLTEEDVGRIRKALDAALKSSPLVEAPQIIDVLDELDSWLSDDRQWGSGSPHNWISLIDDLRAAIEDLGPRLNRALHDQNPATSGELKHIRAEFRHNSPPSDGSLRRRLTRLVATLGESLIRDEALRGAWGVLPKKLCHSSSRSLSTL